MVNGGQITAQCTAAIHSDLHDHFTAAHNGNPLQLTKPFIHAVHNTGHYDVVSSAIFADEYWHKCPHKSTKQA